MAVKFKIERSRQ